MADVSKKKRSRAGIVGYITKLVNGDIAKIYNDYKDEHLMSLMCYKDTIEEKLKNVLKLSDEIQDTMNDADFQADFDKYADIEVSVRKDLSKLVAFIDEKHKLSSTRSLGSSLTNPAGNVKLPRFEIKKFDGDPTKWKSFIESFDAAVHTNSSLTDIEKMNFLINYIEGEAENVINGLLLTNDNYLVAKGMLEDRYGDQQVLVTAHMSKLLNLDVIGDIGDIKGLRRLYDEVETQVRSLEGLKLDPKQYGPMLTPVLLSKLPAEFQLIISRNFGKAAWDIIKIMNFFNAELEAREKINFGNISENILSSPATGSSLLTSSSNSNNVNGESRNSVNDRNNRFDRHHKFGKVADKKRECTFCDRNHDTLSCKVVTKPDARKSILYQKKCCFKCFKPFHSSAECWRNIKCFKCKGAHHTSICTFENRNEKNPDYSQFYSEGNREMTRRRQRPYMGNSDRYNQYAPPSPTRGIS